MFCYPQCSKCIWPDTISCLLLPKVLRGRTVPRQNHEVGETCIHSLPFCNDNPTLDSLHLPIPKCLLQLCIALDLPYFLGGSCCFLLSNPSLIVQFTYSKNVQWLPKRSQAIKISSLVPSSLFPTAPLQCSTASESPTLPLLFTHLLPELASTSHLHL